MKHFFERLLQVCGLAAAIFGFLLERYDSHSDGAEIFIISVVSIILLQAMIVARDIFSRRQDQ